MEDEFADLTRKTTTAAVESAMREMDARVDGFHLCEYRECMAAATHLCRAADRFEALCAAHAEDFRVDAQIREQRSRRAAMVRGSK